MKKTKQKESEFLEAVNSKIEELKAMFDDEDEKRTLFIIATDEVQNGSVKMIAGIQGQHGNIVQSITQVLQDKTYESLIKDAIELHLIRIRSRVSERINEFFNSFNDKK